jgi:hypothetical protein
MLVSGTDYKYLKYKGIHTLKNLSQTTLFTYSVTLVKTFSKTLIVTGTLAPNETVTLLSQLEDGEYKITLTDVESFLTSFTISHHVKLLAKVVSEIKNLVCNTCDDCKNGRNCDNCSTQLSAVISAQTYYHLNYSLYDSFMSNMTYSLAALLGDSTILYMNDYRIKGKGDPEKLTLKILGIYYLAFYYADLAASIDANEVLYVYDFYSSEQVLNCLQDLGVKVASGEQAVDTSINVYFWQLSQITDTLDSVKLILSDNFIKSKATYPLQDFAEGKVITYNNVARIAFVLQDVRTTSFAIYDSLNNNVTTQFDSYYDSNIKALLYVSKVSYSFGNIYFKIKNLTA